jgi:bifunctional DNA-binding transcriptional regulator/antitoxin component of YhaV-PrlF toxin-antitoxin module
MSDDWADAESTVSGSQVNIPAPVRRELGIDDGDQLRWKVETDGSVRVRIVGEAARPVAEYDGYGSTESADVTIEYGSSGTDYG